MLFWPKTDVPENNSGRECCWPYLMGQHPLSSVFGPNRPGTLGNSYFAQLPPVFGHFMFLSGGLLDYSNRSTWVVEVDNIFPFSVNNFGSNQLYSCLFGGYSRSFLKKNQNAPRPSEHPPVRGEKMSSFSTPARPTTRNFTVRQGDA